MKLIDRGVVRKTLGFDSMSDVNDTIDSVLDMTTAALSSRLRFGDLREGTHTDCWHVDKIVRVGERLYRTEFRTRHRFIKEVTGISYARQIKHFGTRDAVDVDVDTVFVEKSGGLIVDNVVDYSHRFVKATYTHGFRLDETANSDEGEASYLSEDVPDWLKEAAKAQAILLMLDTPVLEQAGVTLNRETYQMILNNILAENIRYTPLALHPLGCPVGG